MRGRERFRPTGAPPRGYAAVHLLHRRVRVEERRAGVEADGSDHRVSRPAVLPHHAVERAVQGVETARGRLEGLLTLLQRVRDPAERVPLDLAVPHVGLLVHREEARRVVVADPVERREALALGAGDLGNLRFVRVERGQALRHRSAPGRPEKLGDRLGHLGGRRRGSEIRRSRAERGREGAPEGGMVLCRVPPRSGSRAAPGAAPRRRSPRGPRRRSGGSRPPAGSRRRRTGAGRPSSDVPATRGRRRGA